jgi:hypothetical protein
MNLLLSSFLFLSVLTKTAFFEAIETDNEVVLEKMYNQVQKAPYTEEKSAYLGAILMKQAAFKFLPNKKLSYFLEGKNLLEKAISKYPKNTELRLIRLMIQENAPKFLGYYEESYSDAKYIKKMYPFLEEELQNIVQGYAKKSKILNL